jgi:hypothetical protein
MKERAMTICSVRRVCTREAGRAVGRLIPLSLLPPRTVFRSGRRGYQEQRTGRPRESRHACHHDRPKRIHERNLSASCVAWESSTAEGQ